jgi:RNA polymerase sigma factor (sigma-70 family)
MAERALQYRYKTRLSFIKTISPDQFTDPELVAAFKKDGDMQYLSALYQRYMELVYGVCLKYFKDSERSKDAVMDIFEELHKKLRNYEVENFKSWLHVLARNHCLMQLRSPRNLKSVEFNPAFVQTDIDPHPEEEYLAKEQDYAKMGHCIEKLPEAQKLTIQLFYLQEKCYNEIVSITGYEWSRIRSYIQNGRRNLKLCMEEKIHELKSKYRQQG